MWLLNFAAKLQVHRVLFGFSVAEADKISNAANWFQWIVETTTTIVNDSKEFTSFKNLMRYGAENVAMVLPAFNLPPVPPGGVDPISGVFSIVRRYAQRIKSNDNYTPGFGQDFGIIGPEEDFDPALYSTFIVVKVFSTYREIHFIKGHAQDVVIYIRPVGSTEWQVLGSGTTSPVVDNRAAPQPVAMEFMAKGRISNAEIGVESNIVQVNYGGTTVA